VKELRSHLTRREALGRLGAAAAMPFLPGVSSPKAGRAANGKPRNVIFILSDDHRYDFMGFMGRPKFLKTPSMDRMAREGAHVKNAFVVTSLCSPSRASNLSGMLPVKHGVVDNDSPLSPNHVFFPHYLQPAGYRTAFIGKWHMGNHADQPQPDYDYWLSFPGQGVYYDPVLTIYGSHVQRRGYITDLLTDYAVDWIREQREHPFVLHLSHKAVHAMFEPAKRDLGLYDKATIEHPASMADTEANYRMKPRWVKEQRNSWHGVDYMYYGEIDFDTFYRRYCETLLALDESTGRVLDALQELGLAENTLVLYMGDNGFSLGEHGLIDKRQMYEESLRVPLLAWAPGVIAPGTVIEPMVQNIDIAPTILDACGVPRPDSMDGTSFLPLLRGETVPWRDAVYYVYYWERTYPQTPTMFGVRTDRYKYVTYYGIWDIDELYDLETDPQEMTNLIADPARLPLVEELRKKVFDWLEQTGGMQIPLKQISLWQANKRRGE
jgi:N-acetylglucosamine-6-sulfatase